MNWVRGALRYAQGKLRCEVRVRAVMLTALLAMGCKLTEELPAPASPPFLVVHSLLNASYSRQFVIVERSTNNNIRAGISGAVVRLTHRTPPPGCASPTVQLPELASPQPGVPGPGIYLTLSLCALRPGDKVDLRVETPDGSVVTGTTTVPGIDDNSIRVGNATTGPSTTTITLDRTRDSLAISMRRSLSPGMQVEAYQDALGGLLTYRTMQKGNLLTIAGNLVDPFDDEGRTVFRAGAYYLLGVAAVDTNYYDYVTSGADPFTGRGFINHLKGAVGIFGSVTVNNYRLKVLAPQTDPREGVYRITGTLAGTPVNITWDLYQDVLGAESIDGNEPVFRAFSGFVEGTWIDGPVSTSANVEMSNTLRPGRNGVADSDFFGAIYGEATDPVFPGQVGVQYTLSGQRRDRGQPFSLLVEYRRNGTSRMDTLTAVQETGP